MLLSDPSEIFRPEIVVKETGWSFRKYDPISANPQQIMVFKTYKMMHTNQTMAFVQKKVSRFKKVFLTLKMKAIPEFL